MTAVTMRVAIVPPVEADAEALSEATIDFRRQALTLPVESVQLVRDTEAPSGAKAIDALSLGHLVIVTLPMSGILSALTAIAIAKIRAGSAREVEVTVGDQKLRMTGQSEALQRQSIERWIRAVESDTGDA